MKRHVPLLLVILAPGFVLSAGPATYKAKRVD